MPPIVTDQSALSTLRRPTRRVTLSMVAKDVGVGITTVSDILNRGAADRYSPEMCKRVHEAVDRLGYTPHRGAQMMKRQRSGMIGLLLTRDFANPFWARFADATEKSLRRAGFLMNIAVCNGDAQTETMHMQRLMSEQVEGLIIGPIYVDRELEVHRNIVRGQVPTVVYGMDVGGVDPIFTDVHANGRLIGEHLQSMGHTRIAVLGDPSTSEAGFSRNTFGGVDSALRRSGHRLHPDWIVRHEDTGQMSIAYELAGRFAARWKAAPPQDRPTAVVCHNDQYAMASLCAFTEAGVRVPDDLSLIGHDNLPESRYTVPPLTTIDIDIEGLIESAVQTLTQRISDPTYPRKVQFQPGRLVVRRSVASKG